MSAAPHVSRRFRLLAWLAAALCCLLITLVPTGLTRADVIKHAITDVGLRQDTASVNQQVTVDVAWQVPDGTRDGDTFHLTLPSQLRALDGTSFDLTAPDGSVVAVAKIEDDVVTFRMTAFAQTHVSVRGSAFFAVSLAKDLTPGKENLVFKTDTKAFPDKLTVIGVVPRDYSNTATKWAKWVAPGPGVPDGDSILWAINGPRIVSPAPMTFTDLPGPGQAIDCSTLLMQYGYSNSGGVPYAGSFARPQWTILECGPSKAVVKLVPQRWDVGRIPVLLGLSSRVGPALASYTNTGSVQIGDGVIPVSTVLAAAGGEGTGTRPPTPSVPGEGPSGGTSGTSGTTPPVIPGESPSGGTSGTSGTTPPVIPGESPSGGTSGTSGTTPPVIPGESPSSGASGTNGTSGTSGTTPPVIPGGSPSSGTTPSRVTTLPAGPTGTVPVVTSSGSTPLPVSGATPISIDTGLPDQSGPIDPILVGLGLALMGAAGVVLLAVSRRQAT